MSGSAELVIQIRPWNMVPGPWIQILRVSELRYPCSFYNFGTYWTNSAHRSIGSKTLSDVYSRFICANKISVCAISAKWLCNTSLSQNALVCFQNFATFRLDFTFNVPCRYHCLISHNTCVHNAKTAFTVSKTELVGLNIMFSACNIWITIPVREFRYSYRQNSYIRDVPELRVPPNLM